MSTDSEIIARSLTRPEAFADLFERHARTVNAFATYRVGGHAAEDVLSETFLVAFRRRADFDLSSDSASPWLLGIASRLIHRHRAVEAKHSGEVAASKDRLGSLAPKDRVDESLAVARGRLSAKIGEESRIPKERTARRPWIVVGGLAGAAAAVTAGVLTLNALTAPPVNVEAAPTRTPGTTIESAPAPSPMPTISTGADALRGAAVAAAQSTAPILAPGQYRRHTWTVEQLLLYDPAPDSDGWSVPGDGRDRTTATGGWVVTRSGARYSPADPRAEWYEEIGPTSLIGALGDGAAHQARLGPMLQASAQGAPLRPMGGVPALDDGDGHGFLWYFDVMPREPRAMIDWVIQYFGLEQQQGWVDGAAGWLLITLLAFNEGDSAMRSIIYQALSLLPGSTVGAEIDGRRTVTFDSNLAGSGAVGSSSMRYTLSIEMSTGLVTETATTSGVGMVMIPDGIPDSRTTYTTSVVDGLP